MIKQTLIALTLAGSAQAMCPNQCSGHGVCKATPKDSCSCYTRRETYDEFGTFSDVVAWTGADCSLREFFPDRPPRWIVLIPKVRPPATRKKPWRASGLQLPRA